MLFTRFPHYQHYVGHVDCYAVETTANMLNFSKMQIIDPSCLLLKYP